MAKRKFCPSKKTTKNNCSFGIDKMIWGLVAFLALAYMVITVAPQVSAK